MFLLMLKTEKPGGMTSLDFVGMYDSKADAEKHVSVEYKGLEESGFGNYRMLSGTSASKLAKAVWNTAVFNGSSYLLAEY